MITLITCKPRESIRQAKLILYVQLSYYIHPVYTLTRRCGFVAPYWRKAALHTVQSVLCPRMAAAAGNQRNQSPASPTVWSDLSSQTAEMTLRLSCQLNNC